MTTDQLRYDGRVAIVTGAGGNPSLGRSYARLLASRGAKVLINDLGVGPDGRGTVKASAENVAEEIRHLGGEAAADTNSVAEAATARAIVEHALDLWGRVDILINNASVSVLGEFTEVTEKDVERVVGVHFMGTVWMCRAVWPHMKAAGYGRIVNITSGSLLGHAMEVIYGAAKGGNLALTRGLAAEGTSHGIRANALNPHAGTVAIALMTEPNDWQQKAMSLNPDTVAPVAALLAHEQCPCSGKLVTSTMGNVWEVFYSRTKGIHSDELTIEEVLDRWSTIVDQEGATFIVEPSVKMQDLHGIAPTPRPYRPD